MYVINAVALIFGTTMLVQAMVVPSGSMETNLMTGDHVLVDKLAYSPAGAWARHLLPYQDVERGDIVVFRYPLNPEEYYVKRVIGVPGDRIRLDGKRVIRNGQALDEPYKRHVDSRFNTYRDWFPAGRPQGLPNQARQMLGHVQDGELVVPAGHYFALGDNRDDSLDSRYWGFVPRENIVGRPVIVWWSYESTYENLRDWNVRHLVDLAQNFFTKTRWRRTLHLVR